MGSSKCLWVHILLHTASQQDDLAAHLQQCRRARWSHKTHSNPPGHSANRDNTHNDRDRAYVIPKDSHSPQSIKEINPTDKRLSNTRARTSTIRVASSVIEATQTIINNSYSWTAVWTKSPELSLGLDGTNNIFLFTSYSKHENMSEYQKVYCFKTSIHNFSSSSPPMLIYSPVWIVCQTKMSDSVIRLVRSACQSNYLQRVIYTNDQKSGVSKWD